MTPRIILFFDKLDSLESSPLGNEVPHNAWLQLRRAISIQPEGKRLLEKDAIAPSAARLGSARRRGHSVRPTYLNPSGAYFLDVGAGQTTALLLQLRTAGHSVRFRLANNPNSSIAK